DRALLLLDRPGHAVVALRAGTGRPLHGLVRADLRLPLRAVRRQERGEALGRSGLVRSVDDRDRLRRELHARVKACDLRRVPRLHLPEEDVGDGLAVELEPGLDAREVVRDRDGAKRGRDLDWLALLDRLEVSRGQRRVTRSEVDGARGELRDA